MIKQLIEAGDDNNVEFPFVCMDTETDGRSHIKNEILEITAIEFNKSGIIGRNLTFLCSNQSGVVPHYITDINGITSEMIKGKPSYLKDGIREKIAEFIGERVLVGQNIAFDIRMSHIKPVKSEDTLKMARTYFVGDKNFTLKDICTKHLGLGWDAEQAHRSEYDVRMTIKSFIELDKRLEEKREENSTLPLFRNALPEEIIKEEISVDKYIEKVSKTGVVLSERDKGLIATQAYSHSRCNTYDSCALKWYDVYVLGKRTSSPPLIIGKACHHVADKASKWCYEELFKNKFIVMWKNNHINTDKKGEDIKSTFNMSGNITYEELAIKVYKNRSKCEWLIGIGYLDLIYLMNEKLSITDYEIPSMPDFDTYEKIVFNSISKHNITDGEVISEIRYIIRRFYNTHGFSQYPGDIMVTEKKIALDKDWNVVDDFFGDNVFWRGIIDKIRWEGDIIDIEDYKTNRVMPTIKELRESLQLKTYVKCVVLYLGRENVDHIRIRMSYLRHGESLEILYSGEEIDEVINQADSWIYSSVEKIESELANPDNAFKPTRNEYCSYCDRFLSGTCPLFDIKKIDNIESDDFRITNSKQCIKWYKQVELLKIKRDKIISECKRWIKSNNDDVILIDGNAKLDFHKEDMIKYDVFKVVTELLSLKNKGDIDRDCDLEVILKFLTLTKANANKLGKKIEYDISSIDVPGAIKCGIKQKFEALVKKDDSKK